MQMPDTLREKTMNFALRRRAEITILRVFRRVSPRIKVYYAARDPPRTREELPARGAANEEIPCSALWRDRYRQEVIFNWKLRYWESQTSITSCSPGLTDLFFNFLSRYVRARCNFVSKIINVKLEKKRFATRGISACVDNKFCWNLIFLKSQNFEIFRIDRT